MFKITVRWRRHRQDFDMPLIKNQSFGWEDTKFKEIVFSLIFRQKSIRFKVKYFLRIIKKGSSILRYLRPILRYYVVTSSARISMQWELFGIVNFPQKGNCCRQLQLKFTSTTLQTCDNFEKRVDLAERLWNIFR